MWRSAWIGLVAGFIAILALSLLQRGAPPSAAAIQTHRWGALAVEPVLAAGPADSIAPASRRVLSAYDVTDILAWAAKQNPSPGIQTPAGFVPVARPGPPSTNRAAVALSAVGPGVVRASPAGVVFTTGAGGTVMLQGASINDPAERLLQWMIRYDFDRGAMTDEGASISSWMTFWSGKLLAVQTPQGHERLRTFLQELREFEKKDASP